MDEAHGPGRGMTGGRAGHQGEGDGPADDECDGEDDQPCGEFLAGFAAPVVSPGLWWRLRGADGLEWPGGGVRVRIRHAAMLQGATA